MKKVSISSAKEYVNNRVPFDAGNVYGEYTRSGKAYVVYSFGSHWPLFAYYRGRWYANSDKYSPTTSKHYTQMKPRGVDLINKDVDGMLDIVER